MNEMNELFEALGNGIQHFLPLSPFREFITGVENIDFGYLNYFIPVGKIMEVTVAWCVAIGAFYAWQIVLRWLKIIE